MYNTYSIMYGRWCRETWNNWLCMSTTQNINQISMFCLKIKFKTIFQSSYIFCYLSVIWELNYFILQNISQMDLDFSHTVRFKYTWKYSIHCVWHIFCRTVQLYLVAVSKLWTLMIKVQCQDTCMHCVCHHK